MKNPQSTFGTIRDSIIEDFGRAYSNFGQNRLKGRIVGLLLANPEPCSLDEICQVLAVSKGPVSTVTRQLQEQGLIRKVWAPGDRRRYYEVVPDIFRAASRHNLKLIRENLGIARRNLERIAHAPADKTADPGAERVRQRLRVMEEFYARLVDSFESFVQEWERSPRGEPALGQPTT